MKYLMWLLKAAIFFTLFAFALNNQQVVAVNFFFGTVWKAPLVMVVLSVFAVGLALGVLMMMPRWWKKRQAGQTSHAGNSQWTNMLEPGASVISSGSPSVGPLAGALASPSGSPSADSRFNPLSNASSAPIHTSKQSVATQHGL